jgi:integrase
MASTKLKIRNDLVKKSGGSATTIYLMYTYQGKPKYFSTGKKIEPIYWDAANQCVKRSYRGYTTLNDFIKGKKRDLESIVIEAQKRKIEPTLQYVERQYELLNTTTLPEENKDFFYLYDCFIEANRGKKAFNTSKKQTSVRTHIKAFEQHTKYQVTLESINLDFHNRFTTYLIKDKNFAPNTIGQLITCLKVFLNSLTESGINTNLAFRQKAFNKPSAPVDLVALTKEELDLLYKADLSKDLRLERVRDVFVFGCVTGMRFSDIENLKTENIKADTIEFTTLKTKDRLSVPLTPYARFILSKYGGKLPKIIRIQNMNVYLKELGQLCGIDEPVQKVRYLGSTRIESKAPKYELMSTHTARRTFCTLALERGTRPEIVMRITGHKDIKTMMKYVRLTDKAAHQEFLRPYEEGNMKVVG